MDLVLKILSNAADILILTYVIYKVLVLLKDNRAMQLIKGIVFLMLVYYISGWLNLRTVHILLSQSWSVLLVGIIIIFQPELRSLLEHLGGGAFLNQTKQEPKERLTGELVKALKAASKSKTGLLVILEGHTGLREYVDTGTAVDASVTSELLGNLFFQNTPLHDGAVIIRGNRIAAAGCIMPLTDNRDIDPALGTRHRAALGISEVCDGLALVVSEENGSISVARGGKLYHRVTPSMAEQLIRDFYSNRKKKKVHAAAERKERKE